MKTVRFGVYNINGYDETIMNKDIKQTIDRKKFGMYCVDNGNYLFNGY
jgi:hypothetical protein